MRRKRNPAARRNNHCIRTEKRPLPCGKGLFKHANYFSEGAPTGQTPAQAPQLMQVPSSITYLPSPAEIAETGHSASQAPQLMHSSEITYAIANPPPYHFDNIVSRSQKKSTVSGDFSRRLQNLYSMIFLSASISFLSTLIFPSRSK